MPVDFTRLKSSSGLARVAGCSEEYVARVLANRSGYYERYELPKRNPHVPGERRVVYSAVDNLKQAQRELLTRLEEWVIEQKVGYPFPQSHGFIAKRGILSNAKNHVAAPLLLRADLEHFFPSIHLARVQQFLIEHLRLDRSFTELLTQFLSPSNALAEGVCASPFLANLVCIDLDVDLVRLATSVGCKYSRYADDLAFSGSKIPTRIELASVCERHGFKLSRRKFRRTKLGQAHYVTGLSISDPHQPRAPKEIKRRLRQELYYARRYGLESHLAKAGCSTFQYGINSIDGRLRFLAGVEPKLARRLRAIWSAILAATPSRPSPTYAAATHRAYAELYGFLDTTELKDGRFAMALVLTSELGFLEAAAHSVLADAAEDPWAGGRAKTLDAKGLHFTDNHPTIQESYIQRLAVLPIRVYIAFTTDQSAESYRRLLNVLLQDRAGKHAHARLNIVCEQEPKIKQHDLDAVANNVVAGVKKRNPASPLNISARIGAKKPDLGLSAADYMLGVFRDYQGNSGEQATKRFERLRGKVRLIVDLDSAQRWHRRRPYTSVQE